MSRLNISTSAIRYGRPDPARRLKRPERLSPETSALYIVQPKVVGRGRQITSRAKQQDLNERLHACVDARLSARVDWTLDRASKASTEKRQHADQHSVPYDEMSPEQAAAEIERLRDRRDAEIGFVRSADDWFPHLTDDEQDKVLGALRLHLDGALSHRDWMRLSRTYRDKIRGPVVQQDYSSGHWNSGRGALADGF